MAKDKFIFTIENPEVLNITSKKPKEFKGLAISKENPELYEEFKRWLIQL